MRNNLPDSKPSTFHNKVCANVHECQFNSKDKEVFIFSKKQANIPKNVIRHFIVLVFLCVFCLNAISLLLLQNGKEIM